MFNRSKFSALAMLLAVALTAAPAFASGGGGIDVSAVVTAVNGTLTPVGLIGAAVLLVHVGIKTYKWVRRAM